MDCCRCEMRIDRIEKENGQTVKVYKCPICGREEKRTVVSEKQE